MAGRVQLIDGPRRQLIDAVAGQLHRGEVVRAAAMLAQFAGLPAPRGRRPSVQLCWEMVRWCLDHDRYADAALLLWSRNQFSPLPRCTQLIWDAVQDHSQIMLMGASSMSKSFGPGVYNFLDWLRDPEFTQVLVIGPTAEHLERNLFSHLSRLHARATLPMPGTVGEFFIGINRRDQGGGILGTVMPRGTKAAGKLQGTKRFNRPEPHPLFGPRSRMRVVLDEVEHIPVGVWSDLDNLTSNLDEEDGPFGTEGLKIIGAFNPRDISGPVAQRCEPVKSWKNLDPGTDEVWTSSRGWRVVRLDAEKCENVTTGRTIFTGLQTRTGLDALARSAGGKDSPSYLTFGRAVFPDVSNYATVFNQATLHDWEGEFIWLDKPKPFAGCDPALEGGDACVVAKGSYGLAVGVRFAPSAMHPSGHVVSFTNERKQVISRPALQLEKLLTLPKGKTVAMATAIRELCVREGVMPGCLMLDRTGNGAGVHDVLRETWSPDARGVNFSESPTEQKIVQEDLNTPKDEYDRVLSELWFAARKWFEFGLSKLLPGLSGRDELFAEFTGRRYDTRGKARVERKSDYKDRQADGGSPDKADAVTLLIHAVRMAGIIPTGLATTSTGPTEYESNEPWPCDCTNRFEDLGL